MFHSIIIEESLAKPRVLRNYKILKTKTWAEAGWHLHIIEITEPKKAIKEIQGAMVEDKPFYFHIYNEGKTLIIVFKNKVFRLGPKDKKTWQEARAFGASKLNIRPEQLDFYPTKISQETRWYNR